MREFFCSPVVLLLGILAIVLAKFTGITGIESELAWIIIQVAWITFSIAIVRI